MFLIYWEGTILCFIEFYTTLIKIKLRWLLSLKTLKNALRLKLLTLLFFFIITCSGFCQNLNQLQFNTLSKIDTTHKKYLQDAWRSTNFLNQIRKYDSLNFSIEYKPKRPLSSFYDPANVIPKSPLELDYRQSSYYTPRVVSDHLNHIMNRPRSDCMVSVPTLALLAASIALQYIDIEKKIEIKAVDYLVEEKYQDILLLLWTKSPQKAEDIYKSKGINDTRNFNALQDDFKKLINLKLVKIKEIEKGAPQYFAAEKKEEVIQLLNEAYLNENLSIDQTGLLNTLLKRIQAIE